MATPPTTLAELATETVTLYADAAASAQADLGAAQAALAAARLQQTADTAALAATQKDLAALRAQLAAAEVPADADVLLGEIAALQVVERRQGAVLLDDADAVAGAQAGADAATAWLRAVNRRAGEAAAGVAPAEAARDRRDRWKAAAVAAPLDTLAADAGDLRDGVDFTAAQAQVEDELPEALRDAGEQGWALENERLARAVGAEQHAWTLLETEVTAGSPVALARALAVADDRLRRWAEQAAQRYARAQVQVAAVLQAPLLTEAEDDALEADVTDGPAAAALRTARETARQAVLVAEAELDDAVLTARAADPTDLDVSDAVTAEQTALDGAATGLDTAQTAFAADEQEAYGTWSGDVPEAAWKKVVGLKEAEATLDELRAADGAALVADDEQAEEALAGALWTAEQQALRVGFLEAQAALRGALLEQTLAARPARLLAALRGDA